MSEALVEKLFKSFDELERCISVTRDALEQRKEVPGEILERVRQYSQIVDKQRGMAIELKEHIAQQNWGEVNRIVRVINGLSAMIRDDAQDILSGSQKTVRSDKSSEFLC